MKRNGSKSIGKAASPEPRMNGSASESTAAPLSWDPGNSGRRCEAMVSSCGEDEERVEVMARSSELRCSDCASLLHTLSNTMTSILMNAQVLAWKLPPYSHLKRPVREVERNAQRSSELLKRLMRQAGSPAQAANELCEAVSGLTEGVTTLAVAGEIVARQTPAGLPPRSSAPVFLPSAPGLTDGCDPRTSGIFPKRDDGSKR